LCLDFALKFGFKDTLDFLEATGAQNATFNILTPFHGTPLHQKRNLMDAY